MTHTNLRRPSAAALFGFFFVLFFPHYSYFFSRDHRKHARQGTNKEKLCILKRWNHFSPLKTPSLKCNERGREEGNSRMLRTDTEARKNRLPWFSHVEEKQEPLMETSSFHYTSICSSQQYLLAAAHMLPWDGQADRQTGRFPVKTRQNVSLAQPINGNIWICSAVLSTPGNLIDICD